MLVGPTAIAYKRYRACLDRESTPITSRWKRTADRHL